MYIEIYVCITTHSNIYIYTYASQVSAHSLSSLASRDSCAFQYTYIYICVSQHTTIYICILSCIVVYSITTFSSSFVSRDAIVAHFIAAARDRTRVPRLERYAVRAGHCNTLRSNVTRCNTLQRTATHCDVLRRTATHCNTLRRTATHCNTLQHTATHCDVLQHAATHYRPRKLRISSSPRGIERGSPDLSGMRSGASGSLRRCCCRYCSVLQCVAVRCSALQCVAVRCSALRCVAVRCSVLQCVSAGCIQGHQGRCKSVAADTAVRRSVLQCVAVCRGVLQCVAVPTYRDQSNTMQEHLQHTRTITKRHMHASMC